MAISAQTLSEAERRLLAGWAATCVERALPLCSAPEPAASQIRDALARTYAYAAGESTTAAEIKLRMVAVKAAGAATTPGDPGRPQRLTRTDGSAYGLGMDFDPGRVMLTVSICST